MRYKEPDNKVREMRAARREAAATYRHGDQVECVQYLKKAFAAGKVPALTVGRKYRVYSINPNGYLNVRNDRNRIETYDVRMFKKAEAKLRMVAFNIEGSDEQVQAAVRGLAEALS